jgi:hypothetical protein
MQDCSIVDEDLGHEPGGGGSLGEAVLNLLRGPGPLGNGGR